ncbi:MAG: hypothetical protein HGA85_05090 [Nanoarchaeota archaeon]|nr:hypothetical protein [Nanoarchaeota archaeon]
MIRVPIETIISKIKDQTGMSDKDIEKKIKDKLDLLSGLISKEGAAHIIANELGVKVFDETSKVEIKNLLPGMRSVEISASVIRIFETRTFERQGTQGKVANFMVSDPTGSCRVVAWNEMADAVQKLKLGDKIKLENAFAKDNNGRTELHMGDRSTLTVTEHGTGVAPEASSAARKKISELKEGDDNVEVMGTIVQTFDPRFFEVCPSCGKRMRQSDGNFVCEVHGQVATDYSYVVNLVLDDGTETIRVVLWKNQAMRLFKLTHEELLGRRTAGFEDVKNDLLGKIIKFVGRTSKNQMFDRLEFVAHLVISDPKPEDEVKRLDTEIAKAEAAKPKEPDKKTKKSDDDFEEIDLADIDEL